MTKKMALSLNNGKHRRKSGLEGEMSNSVLEELSVRLLK
jgi:hypothetical protein